MLNLDRTAGRHVIGLVDIGTAKICCLVAIVSGRSDNPLDGLHVAGIGHQRSKGIKAGMIVDMDAAEDALRATIGQAERMSGLKLEDVYVAVSCGRVRSQHFAASADVEGGVVRDGELRRIAHSARLFAGRDARSVVHMTGLGYRLDGVSGIREPRGMAGRRLTADIHAVTTDDAPLRNLLLLNERSHLTASGLAPAALASGLASTTDEERRQGIVCLDIGAGTTSISAFCDNNFLFCDAIPVGGNHISYDIARALVTPLEEAERIKTLYGTLMAAPSDERETITYPLAGSEEPALHQTTRAALRCVMQARFESLLGLVSERLERSGVAGMVGGRIVLTGGVAQTVGLADMAAGVLRRPVRIARPAPLNGMPASIASPAFSTVFGLAAAVTSPGAGIASYLQRQVATGGYLGRMGQWLRESF